MIDRFTVKASPHSSVDHIQWCIEAHDLSLEECQMVRGIVTNNLIDGDDYKARGDASPFLQGYQEPGKGKMDGWVLVEFWSEDRLAIQGFVDYVNNKLKMVE